jgi:ribosomal protein L35AE/L33A
LGKKLEYKDKHGNVYHGKIVRKHGKRGYIATFKPNLPPYALGGRAILKE